MIMMTKLILVISALAVAGTGDERPIDGLEVVPDLLLQDGGEGVLLEETILEKTILEETILEETILEETMISEELEYGGGVAKGYVIPIGPAKIVFAVGAKGMVGCGAFDVQALERFGYPAARVRPAGSGSIESLEDLLEGEVKDANGPAAALGVEVGMRGRDALELL